MYVIETILPDGPYWYSGTTVKAMESVTLEGHGWSPYWADRLEMDKEKADKVFSIISEEMEGAKVVTPEDSQKSDGRWANNNQYYMRAKFLQAGSHFSAANVKGVIEVVKVNRREIFIRQDGVTVTIPKDSTQWVRIEQKPKLKKDD